MQKLLLFIFLTSISLAQEIDSTAIDSEKTEILDSTFIDASDSISIGNDTTKIVDSLGYVISNDTSKIIESDVSKIIDPEGYRGMHWGMNENEVTEFILQNDTTIFEKNIKPITNGFEYIKRISNTSALISYQFDYHRLYIIRIKLNMGSSLTFDYLDKFDEIQNILNLKYGNATRSGYKKVDDSYLSTIESVRLGFAKKYTLWEFERTFINLMLTGRNKKYLDIKITYGSKPIINEIKDRKEILKYDDF